MSSRSKRVLAIAAGAALLVLLLVVALIVWLSDAVGPDDSPTDINSIITSSDTAAPSQAPAAQGGPVQLRSATVIDYSQQTPDSSANVGNVITGQSPPWRTDLYRGGPRFGNLKPGLGLMIALQNPTAVRTVTVRTPDPGVSLQIRTSPSADASFDSTVPVAAVTVGQPITTVTVDQPRQSPYILVWLTELPQVGRGYQGVISQISMTS